MPSLDPLQVVYPGYKTAIRQHENSVLLNVDVTYRVARSDTVLQQLNTLWNAARGKKDAEKTEVLKKALIGSIVMTPYNKKTYR